MFIAPALLATKLVVLLTGVVALVPSVKEPGLVRVVAPNARVPNDDEGDLRIPSHVTYVMFNLDDLASTDPTVSRQPDYVISKGLDVTVGVCLIKGEYLQAGPFTSTATAADAGKLPPELFDCCRDQNDTKDVPLDRSLLKKSPDPERVGLRLDLRHGAIGNVTASIDSETSYLVKADNKTCRPLTRLVSVELAGKGDVAGLTITSTPFRGSVQQRPLVLQSESDELRIMIGNEPLADIPETADFLLHPEMPQPSHHPGMQTDSGFHMRILRRLTQGQVDVLTPQQIKFSECDQGVFKPTGGTGGGTGKPDGCNPSGIRADDPADEIVHKRKPKE